MWFRYTISIFLGVLATTLILFSMQTLIAMQPGYDVEPRQRHALDFVRLKRDEIVNIDEVPRFDELLDTLPPKPPRISSGDDSVEMISLPTTAAPAPTGAGRTVLRGIVDGPVVAMMHVRPEYPPSAITRGIEGHVVVAFDVSADGLVHNIRIVGSSHPVFERAALRAAERFRYKPAVVDGAARETTGLRYRFTFRLEE